MLRMNDTELYKEARLSATSLTYYGRCLAKGNYTVTLYFSEIVLTDDNAYTSTRRRLFDIYIQVPSSCLSSIINTKIVELLEVCIYRGGLLGAGRIVLQGF